MSRKIECIARLLEKNHSYDEIAEWLVINKFTNKIALDNLTRDKERAEFIYNVLKQRQLDEDIQLLYFEWNILPQETIKITCVTNKEEKFFTYGL